MRFSSGYKKFKADKYQVRSIERSLFEKSFYFFLLSKNFQALFKKLLYVNYGN